MPNRGYPSLELMAEATEMPSGDHRRTGSRRLWGSGRESTDPPDQRPLPQQHQQAGRRTLGWWGRHFGRGKDNEDTVGSNGSHLFSSQGGLGHETDVDVENAAEHEPSAVAGKLSTNDVVGTGGTGESAIAGRARPRGSRSLASGDSRIFPR